MSGIITLKDYKGSNIEKSYETQRMFTPIAESREAFEKSQHARHKYVRIDNGKYIYDNDKMSKEDHEETRMYHAKLAKEHNEKGHDDQRAYHAKLAREHDELANDKKSRKENSNDKVQNALDKKHRDHLARTDQDDDPREERANGIEKESLNKPKSKKEREEEYESKLNKSIDVDEILFGNGILEKLQC